MMLRREAIEQTKGFDEQFFMYCEEIDWAWRIHKAGWSVKCVPAARVTHLEARSTTQVRPQSIVNLWKSRLLLYGKHHPAWKNALGRRMIVAGMGRKIQQAEQNTRLDAAQKATLIEAYRTVQQMANA